MILFLQKRIIVADLINYLSKTDNFINEVIAHQQGKTAHKIPNQIKVTHESFESLINQKEKYKLNISKHQSRKLC